MVVVADAVVTLAEMAVSVAAAACYLCVIVVVPAAALSLLL